MKTRNETFVQLQQVLMEHFGPFWPSCDKSATLVITETTTFLDDLYIDSLDSIELVIECEDSFGIRIPDDDVHHIMTVGDAVDYLQARIGKDGKNVSQQC